LTIDPASGETYVPRRGLQEYRVRTRGARMKIIVLAVAISLLLAGCQRSATVRDSQINRWVLLDGAQLQVRQALPVAAGKARVFVQDGVVSGGFDNYRTHCAFEIDNIDHDGATIEPDIFQVVRVQHTLVPVVQARPLMIAGPWRAAGIDGFGGSSSYHEGYHFWIYSERQPQVMRMSCYGVYAQPYELEPPTLADIRNALGGLAEIRR
jgi:hypothetical protein